MTRQADLNRLRAAGPYYCPLCMVSCVYPNGVITHCKSVHDDDKRACIVCEFSSELYEELAAHINSHIENFAGIECRICDDSIMDGVHLKDCEDAWSWRWNKTGKFSVRSMYKEFYSFGRPLDQVINIYLSRGSGVGETLAPQDQTLLLDGRARTESHNSEPY
ncbi:hypothetical protein FRX31_012186 [Thalictrum thalictroides]|uniref:C2H2-type domain-containing protein n=1 Tax=Thalictrum thalictroides TaxID=46969 RepID=A0A7J6WMR3_THATH|nr:hypothetical protein FRX31_012186 [Thalictrum thalictroides]